MWGKGLKRLVMAAKPCSPGVPAVLAAVVLQLLSFHSASGTHALGISPEGSSGPLQGTHTTLPYKQLFQCRCANVAYFLRPPYIRNTVRRPKLLADQP